MKSTVFIILLLLACIVDAQTGEYYYTSNPFEYDNYYLSGDQQKTRVANKVKSITETTTVYKKDAPQNKVFKTVYGLNEKGQTILKEEFDSKGQLMRKHSFVVNDSGWIEEKKISDGKGKILYQYNKVYNPATGNILSYEYRKNNKLVSKYTSKYEGIYLTERTVYKKDGQSIRDRFVYSFNADMKLQTTHLYDGAGKLKHTWNHQCLPEGELMAARKDTTTVCKMREESADGHFVNYVKSVNEKGELTTTTIWYRTERMADSVKVVTEGKHPSTQISRYSEDGSRSEYLIIDENNRITYKYFSFNSESGNQLKYENWMYNKKDGLQLTFCRTGEENKQGLLTKSSEFRKNSLKRVIEYSYTTFR